jgi:hypothetical protein
MVLATSLTIRAMDFNTMHDRKPSDRGSLVTIAYSGGTFIELIEPTSRHSIFHDWLEIILPGAYSMWLTACPSQTLIK